MVTTASVYTQRRIARQLAEEMVSNLRAECAARSADASDTAVMLLSRLSTLLDVEWRVDKPTDEFAPTDTSIVCNIIDALAGLSGSRDAESTVLYRGLLAGCAPGPGSASLRRIASRLCVDRRTLARTVASQGGSRATYWPASS
jgi:hypothetical protein